MSSNSDLKFWSHSAVNLWTFGTALLLLIWMSQRDKFADWEDFGLGILTGLVIGRVLWVGIQAEKRRWGDHLTRGRLLLGLLRQVGLIVFGLACFAGLAYIFNAFDLGGGDGGSGWNSWR